MIYGPVALKLSKVSKKFLKFCLDLPLIQPKFPESPRRPPVEGLRGSPNDFRRDNIDVSHGISFYSRIFLLIKVNKGLQDDGGCLHTTPIFLQINKTYKLVFPTSNFRMECFILVHCVKGHLSEVQASLQEVQRHKSNL